MFFAEFFYSANFLYASIFQWINFLEIVSSSALSVRLSKQEVEEIINKLPAYEEPLAYGSLTEEQFNEEIEKAKEVEEEYDNVVANEA